MTITEDSTGFKRIKGKYYEKNYAHNFYSLDEMNKFLESSTDHLSKPKMIQDGNRIRNSSIPVNEIEFPNLSTNKL